MKIIWTDFAIKSLKEIFNYYSETANRTVAHKIRKEILHSTKQLIKNPQSGQTEPSLEKLHQYHRYLVSGHYKVIYRLEENLILINDVFDTRQHPGKMTNR